MSNPKGRTLPNAISMYFVMLAIYCLDIFVFQSDLTVLGDAFFSRFFSFIIIFMYTKASKDSLAILGISKKKEKFVAGGIYGALFSLVPLFLVMLGEVVYYASTDASMLNLNFSPPSLNYVRTEGHMTSVGVTAIYIATTFFGSAFKEFFFRGFLLKKMNKVMNFFSANLFQALLYMSFILPSLARNFLRGYYNSTTAKLAVFIIIFYIVHETLAGIKWGLMTRISGSTYIATVDHFLYVFLSNSFFVTSRYETWAFMLHMMAIQLVSLAMTLVYYAVGMKRINAKKLKEKQEEEEAKARREARRKEREANRVIKSKIEPLEEISPEYYRSIASDARRKSRQDEDSDAPLENTVFIENAIQEKPTAESAEDSDVDDFLKKMTRQMRRSEEPTRSDEITEDFDSDDFLKAYQNGKSHHHRHSGHSHHHHSHHHHSEEKMKEETTQENNTTEKDSVAVPVRKKMAKKPKRTLAQKIRDLGGVDDSSSNDLIL